MGTHLHISHHCKRQYLLSTNRADHKTQRTTICYIQNCWRTTKIYQNTSANTRYSILFIGYWYYFRTGILNNSLLQKHADMHDSRYAVVYSRAEGISSHLGYGFSNCGSRWHYYSGGSPVLRDYLKYSISAQFWGVGRAIRFNMSAFGKCSCNWRNIWRVSCDCTRTFHSLLEVLRGCKVIWVPAITVQSDKDPQLHFSLTSRDRTTNLLVRITFCGRGITKSENLF
jgi:hypothetical protein